MKKYLGYMNMKNVGIGFRFWSIALIFFIFIAGCGPDYSIRVEGETIASVEGREERSNLVSVTEYENPVVTGVVRQSERDTLSSTPTERVTCCDRILMRSNSDSFASERDANFISTAYSVGIPRGDDVRYRYRVPILSLPPNGQQVQLRLEAEGDTKVFGSIGLASDVIVLPVHVHVFLTDTEAPRIGLRENEVRTWFGSPAFETEAVSVREGRGSPVKTYTISRTLSRAYADTDRVWDQARIQFKFESYEQVRQNEGLSRVLVNVDEASGNRICNDREDTRLWRYHSINMAVKPGIHIYVGGDINPTSLDNILSDTPGATCGPFSICRESTSSRDFILLDRALRGRLPFTLAHELGHYLGLHHANLSERSCGGMLLGIDDEPRENLMWPSPRRDSLSADQISRARSLACSYLRDWGMPSSACV